VTAARTWRPVREAASTTGASRDPWLAALLVGLAVRLPHLGAAPLWFDEVMTADWVAHPWREMLAPVWRTTIRRLLAVAKLAHDVLGDSAGRSACRAPCSARP
jgi:hypothetical protein